MNGLSQAAITLAVAVAVVVLLMPVLPEAGRAVSEESEEPQSEAPRIRIAEIHVPDPETTLRSEETPQVTATPSIPDPPSPLPSESSTVRPTAQEVERGQELLEEGAFPRLRATYARIGFPAYRDSMVALGGRFFLFDLDRRQPVAEVDPRTGARLGEEMPGGLSRWPRDVTRHLPFVLEGGREIYGERVSRVVLLPPAPLDAALLGALDREMRARGLDPAEAIRIDVAYELRAGRLHCEVLGVALRSGRETPLPLVIDLSHTGVRS